MESKQTALEQLKSESEQWSKKIAHLQAKAEAAEGSMKSESIGLVESLKDKQANVDRSLNQVASQADSAWEQEAARLKDMFKDIDDDFRKAMAYLF